VVLGLAVILSLAVGFLTGGSLRHVSQVRLRFLPLLIGALVVQILIFSAILGTRDVIHRIGPYLYIGTLLVTLAVMLLNRHVPGMTIIAIGAALNAIVITANGGFMPSPESALRDAGRLDEVLEDERERADGSYVLSNSTLADDDTRLLFLGDVLAIPKELPLANVISIGDIIIAIGAIVAILRVMHLRPTTPRGPREPEDIESRPGPTPVAC
jgi:hypothetical protein